MTSPRLPQSTRRDERPGELPRPDLPAVSARIEPSGVRVSIAIEGPVASYQFAFYLFRDDQRVAQSEYGPLPATHFALPNIPGRYRAVAFVKERTTGRIDRYGGPRLTFPDVGEYDSARWRLPIHEAAAQDALSPVDGIHRFLGKGTTSLDFLLQDVEALNGAPAVLVCFNGAVSQRANKTGPFFAGTGIARRLKLPVICVADPSLTRARDISLAWYAGCDDHADLPQQIARHLDAVATAVNRPLVLLGGSGGAYAALSVIRHVQAPAAAVACNPQSAIHRYHRQSVVRYIERAFPAVARRFQISAPSHQTPEHLRQALTAARVSEDLAGSPDIGRFRTVILQNINDRHHVDLHLKPLMFAAGARWDGPRLAQAGNEFGAWLGNWGEGHVAPPASILESVVLRIAANEPVGNIIEELDERFGETALPGSF